MRRHAHKRLEHLFLILPLLIVMMAALLSVYPPDRATATIQSTAKCYVGSCGGDD